MIKKIILLLLPLAAACGENSGSELPVLPAKFGAGGIPNECRDKVYRRVHYGTHYDGRKLHIEGEGAMVSSVELYLTEKCVIASVGFLKYRAAELEDDGFYIFAVDIPVKEENCNEKDEEKKCKSYIGYQRLFQKDFRLAPNSEYFSKKSIRDVVFYDVEGKFVVFQMPDRVVQFSLDFPLLVDDL